MYKVRCHWVSDMDFRRVPEVQLTQCFITDWNFAACAETLEYSTIEDLEGLYSTKYHEQLAVVGECLLGRVSRIESRGGRGSSLWRLPFGECYRFGIF